MRGERDGYSRKTGMRGERDGYSRKTGMGDRERWI